MKRAITYSRSTKSWQYEGPQRPAMEDFYFKSTCKQLGAEVIERFTDELVEQDNPDRPGWAAALEYCENHQVDYLIYYWWSMVYYPGHDRSVLVERLAKVGTQVIECQVDYSDNPQNGTPRIERTTRSRKARR